LPHSQLPCTYLDEFVSESPPERLSKIENALKKGNFVQFTAVRKVDPNAIAVAVAKPCYILVREISIVWAKVVLTFCGL
jgi:hypothetical protein